MKAIVINGCCKAEDLHISEIPTPQVKPGWVLVKVRAAGLNHSEALMRLYEADRDYIHTPIVPGIECVGEVADASDSGLRVGDRVIAIMGGMGRSFDGSYAEYALLPATHVFRVDTDLDWTSLAAVPETYFTAHGSLFESLRLEASDTLLVRGATSTVGMAAVQLAKAVGARVIAACRRESSFEKLQAAGADHCVIDDERLSEHPWAERPNKMLELVGIKTLDDSLRTVTEPGYVCHTGNLGFVFTASDFNPIKDIPNGVYLTSFYSNYPTQAVIDDLFQLIRRGSIRPLYSKVFGMDEIATAHKLLETGGAGGKIVLRVS
ncbi:Zn-dependent oxidoreductase [Tannerella sp. oral taxon BU063 isolate Cell 2]|uniref:Zn-dependent oxidoreductase n=1 Tax=Tannerella sp. oral taxon BU063 isolate Cell 2 TaxID=1411148 RepID=W2C866_9BACT|nr:Zn-dependent oxidoreductase [Tannerella sp. oral taxon BU063 isolate Cell 2]